MSEQAEQISGESGSLSAGVSHLADAPGEPVVALEASLASTPAAKTGSEPNVAAAGALPSEAHASEAAKAEVSAPASQPESSKSEASRPDTRSEPEDTERHSVFGAGRIAAVAAMVALATAAGAVGGALATSAFMRGGAGNVAVSGSQPPLEASLSRVDADIQALKSGLEHTSKLGMNQFNKTSDRLDKLERAQTEPAAKIAKLSEAVDKLRAAPAAAPSVAASATPAAAKDITGSISAAQAAPTAPAVTQQAAATPPKSEVGRLPTVDGWVLRDVADGGALIDGRRGVYEVYAGDFIPGLGRIDAIRRQDGRWVVVTSKGLIVARQ